MNFLSENAQCMLGRGHAREELAVIKFQRQTNYSRSSLANGHTSNLHLRILPLSLGSGMEGLDMSHICAQRRVQSSARTQARVFTPKDTLHH